MSAFPSIVWLGFHEEGRFALPALIKEGFDVKAVLTLADEAAARRSGVFDFSALAQQHGIPCHEIEHINKESSIQLLREYAADVLCVIGWSQILSAEALQTADIVIGAHASLLPEGKGSAPINWALIKDMTSTGNTLIRLSEGVDEGDILAQRAFEISDDDTCATLYNKVAETNASMLIEVLGKIRDGTLQPTPQPKTNEPLWPRRRPADGLIDWTQGSRQVYNFVRALTRPYPGAFSYIDGRKVIVWRASQVDVDTAPGLVTVDNGVFVGCGEGAISICDIEVEGKGSLQGEALVRFFENVKAFERNGE